MPSLTERNETLKATSVRGKDRGRFESRTIETDDSGFAEFLEPPYELKGLLLWAERSNVLRECVDAYVTNIDSYGHRFEPTIKLDEKDTRDKLRDAMLADRMADKLRADPLKLVPTDAEVDKLLESLDILARAERSRLEAFFDSCCVGLSFVELRRRTRKDLEDTGNAYWEVLRSADGQIARLSQVQSHTMRLAPVDTDPTVYDDFVRVSPLRFKKVRTARRFRRYVQVDNQGLAVAWFKGLGDPRVMDKSTGKYYGSVAEMKADNEDAVPATEVVHFLLWSPRTSYGVPRWIGRLLSVLGSRSMEEVNYGYFESKSVPPLAVLVSGGARLNTRSIDRITRFMDEHLRGKENFHSVLVLQAETLKKGAKGGERARIELKPLTSAQLHDATHQSYDETNREKIGASFRLPRILRGQTEKINRATAEAAVRLTEDQVFQPERDAFDYFMNRVFLPLIGARLWVFVSQTRVTRDPDRAAQNLERLVKAGILTPEEARVVAEDILNRELPQIREDWVKRPIVLTLAGIQTSQRGPDEAREMLERRDAILKAAGLTVEDLFEHYFDIEPLLSDDDDV